MRFDDHAQAERYLRRRVAWEQASAFARWLGFLAATGLLAWFVVAFSGCNSGGRQGTVELASQIAATMPVDVATKADLDAAVRVIMKGIDNSQQQIAEVKTTAKNSLTILDQSNGDKFVSRMMAFGLVFLLVLTALGINLPKLIHWHRDRKAAQKHGG